MAHTAPHNTQALAGRPPFATDDEVGNEIYSTPPTPRRVRQIPAPDPNSRTSAYNVYDQYLDDSKRQSGAGALGMGFMNGDIDSDDDDDDDDDDNPPKHAHNKHTALAAATHPQQTSTQSANTIPLASPRPGYAANPIAALDLSRSSPAVATPEVRPQQQQPPPAQVQAQAQGQAPHMQRQMQMHMPQAQRQVQMQMPMPRSQPHPHQRPQMSQLQPLRTGMPPLSPLGPQHRLYNSSPSPSVPSTPHPLEAPITPITPAFLRPSKSPYPKSRPDIIKFVNTPVIMRSNSEDHLLPKRGDKGDDFWRRFSMVAKEEKGKESTWLRKTQNGTTRLSRWVWLIGIIFAISIAGGISVGWYFGHTGPSNQQPIAIGGSAEEGVTSSLTSTSSSSSSKSHGLSSPHVTPTNTVARRFPYPEPTGAPIQLVHVHPARSGDALNVVPHRRRHGSHVNRILHGY